MSAGARLVPRSSAVYREFERLYRLAQSLRPTGVDRWNGELYATEGANWGGFHPATGRISVAGDLVLRHLEGSGLTTSPERQAQALATVLHEATHAGMPTDAPHEPNAVRSEHSLGLMEGFAEVRSLEDFDAFARLAGYPGLALPTPEYPAVHAAVENLMEQASGPRKPWEQLIAEGTRGPGVMHFDQLADGVLRNRLHDVVPDREEDRRPVRAALIATMVHKGWLVLKDLKDVGTGQAVANDIRRDLNAKVDQIRHHYQATPHLPLPADTPTPSTTRTPDRPAVQTAASSDPLRFLTGQAPASGATRYAPSLGNGARGAGDPSRPVTPHNPRLAPDRVRE